MGAEATGVETAIELFELGSFESATARLQFELTRSPLNPDALAWLGWSQYHSLGQDQRAAAVARRHTLTALEIDPSNYAANLVLGVLSLRHDGDFWDAVSRVEWCVASVRESMRKVALDSLEKYLTRRDPGRFVRICRRLIRLAGHEQWSPASIWRQLARVYEKDFGDLINAGVAYRMAGERRKSPERLREVLRWRSDTTSFAACRGLWAECRNHPDEDFRYRVAEALSVVSGFDCGMPFSPSPARAGRAINPKLWNDIRDKRDSVAFDALAEALEPSIENRYVSLSDLGLDDAMRIPDADLPDAVKDALEYVSKMLSVPVPAVYVSPDFGYEVYAGATKVPILIFGDDVLRYPQPRRLLFLLAKSMSYLSPGRMFASSRPAHEVSSQFQGLLKNAETISAQHRQRVKYVATRLPAGLNEGEVRAWQRGMLYTALRVAVILSGTMRPLYEDDSIPAETREELLDFWLSPRLGSARKALGLSRTVAVA